MTPIVCCIKTGDKYGPEYVNKLAAQVARFTTQPYRFLCLTDDAEGVHCKTKPISFDDLDLPGWWNKLRLFAPHPALKADQVIFLDLDVVIVRSIDWLLTYKGTLGLQLDPWGESYSSAVMSFQPGKFTQVWDLFQGQPEAIMKNYYGDQDWLTAVLKTSNYPVDLWPRRYEIGSYKANGLEGGPGDFSIILFHGQPKPADFTSGWVVDAWQ